jgi:hypothetical protein
VRRVLAAISGSSEMEKMVIQSFISGGKEMKKLILGILISLLLIGTAWAWEAKTMYIQYAASGNGQTLLYAGSTEYCHVLTAYICNDGSTTSTVSMHFEGTGSATNRLIPPISLAAGEGMVFDFAQMGHYIIGGMGRGIQVDSSAATTLNAYVVYFIDTKKRTGRP